MRVVPEYMVFVYKIEVTSADQFNYCCYCIRYMRTKCSDSIHNLFFFTKHFPTCAGNIIEHTEKGAFLRVRGFMVAKHILWVVITEHFFLHGFNIDTIFDGQDRISVFVLKLIFSLPSVVQQAEKILLFIYVLNFLESTVLTAWKSRLIKHLTFLILF